MFLFITQLKKFYKLLLILLSPLILTFIFFILSSDSEKKVLNREIIIEINQLLNPINLLNKKNIEEKIKKQKNIFNLGFSYKKIEIDNTFPKYIIENKEKLKEWII